MPIPLHTPEALSRAVSLGLERVVERFDAQLLSPLSPVADLCRHVERYRGKMLRPTVALLSGIACSPDADSAEPESLLTHELVSVAAVCEMVHMATLVHDDVLDEADTRRRGPTVNSLHGNEPAVILGDYLIAAAYHLCSQLDSQAAALAIGRACMDVCAGELLQLHHRENFELDEPTYFEIVARKTGELVSVACELGARLAPGGCAPGAPDALASFGRNLGIAFQIQDDLLDLTGEERVVGKSVGKDSEKGKLTLPLIHHLRNACPPPATPFSPCARPCSASTTTSARC